MIKVQCEQGTPEWRAAKVAVASASNFERLVTPSAKPSTQADAYLYELITEYITGEMTETYQSYWMARGKEMEYRARAVYQFAHDKVTEVGFVYKNKHRLVGCSPDGLVLRRKRGLELKCPSPSVHIAYLLAGVLPKQYVPQVQGSMWVTGFNSWDFMSFHPDYDPLILTVYRDPVWMEAFDKIVVPFTERLAEFKKAERVIHLRNQRIAAQEAA